MLQYSNYLLQLEVFSCAQKKLPQSAASEIIYKSACIDIRTKVRERSTPNTGKESTQNIRGLEVANLEHVVACMKEASTKTLHQE